MLAQIGFPSAAYADEPTDRVRALLEDNSEGGTVGLYLKEVNGSVLAAYNEGFIFEPASAIKALIHFHAMRQVQDGAVINSEVVTLSTQIPWFSDGGPDDCPSLTGPASDTLSNGLAAMMGPSDNRWTQAMRDFFGDANIDATRQQFGMTDSALLHMIGCGGPPPNQLTL
ncbi:MAG: serine hydrolase, partial [Nitrososphaera sp.]